MNTIKYSDLSTWNDWEIGQVLENYADEIKDIKDKSQKDKILKRYIKLIKLQVINDGHIMENETFAKTVESGGFNCFDGCGAYMTETGEETHYGVSFNPDDIRKKRQNFPYIAWYNK